MSRDFEVWRDIPSAPNYQASSRGRLRSVYFNNRYTKDRYRPRVCKPSILPTGYLSLTIRLNGKSITKTAHRLICEAFHGHCPEGMMCTHINGIRHDNRPENLRWATGSENQTDRFRHGTASIGEANPLAKLTRHQVYQIRERRLKGEPVLSIAADYGICSTLVGKIHRRQIWAWL